MRKALLVVVLVFMASVSHAASIMDQLYGGFVGRAKLAIESTTEGKIQPEFLVNYIEIGRIKGAHIAAVDAGALGEILPSSGEVNSVHWTTGFKIHIAPLLKHYMHLPPEWEFLGNTELDARASYDWTGHHGTYGLVAAYPFK